MTDLCHVLVSPFQAKIEELEQEKAQLKMKLDEAKTNNNRLTVENVNLNKQYKQVKWFANKIEDHLGKKN